MCAQIQQWFFLFTKGKIMVTQNLQYCVLKMNNLDFSPISEKDQQSIDVLSFLHTPNTNEPQQKTKASVRLFEKLSRVLQNRKRFSLQLLKQFILFSEEEETIFVPYKYSRYELENGINCMQNTYGIRLKITVGKAFEDIRSYCIKKKTYQNPAHLEKFVTICNKVRRSKEKQTLRQGIKIMRNFIDQQKQQMQKQSNINQHKQKTTELSFHKKSKQIYDMESELTQFTKLSERKQNISKQFHRMFETERVGKYLNYKKEDFLKTAKALNRGNPRQQKKMRINWNEENSNQISEEESRNHITNDNNIKQKQEKYIFKSKSTREHHQLPHFARSSNPNFISSNPAFHSSNKEAFQRFGSQNICDEQVFKTHRRNSHKNYSKHHHSYQQNENTGIQNVVIIRSCNTPKRVPDRYIRIPVLSEQIKIIQIKPDQQKNNMEQKRKKDKNTKSTKDCQMLTKKLQTISSNHKKSEKSSSRHSSRQNIQEFVIDKNYTNQKNFISSKPIHNIEKDHDCLGCKYCQFLKDVQAYRLQRVSKTAQYNMF